MKKYSKLFIFTLLAFFISSVSVLAREMGIDELGEEASKIQPDAGYVYILGEYAFTSNYNIHQEDLIIAATSLKLENPTDLSQAVIYQIERKRDENYNPIGWKEGKNVLGTKKIPSKFNVKWIDMHHILEKSKATLSADIEDSNYSTYKSVLSDKLNFRTEEFYDKNNKVKIENNKVTGLLLKKSHNDLYFNEEDDEKYADAEYYFATIVEVPNANTNTIVTVTNLKGQKKKTTWKEFDVTDSDNGKTPGVVILFPINKTEWENSTKQITISVDVDGDITENEYEATSYTLDLSGLQFQQDSTATLADTTDGVSQVDLDTLKNWGYTFPTNKNYKLEQDGENVSSYKLTGKIEPQLLNANGWSKEEQNGYFFLFTLKKPDDLESVPEGVKVTVTGLSETKTFGKEYFNEEGIFVDLFKLNPDCSDDCKITIKVDWDGDGEEYLESKEITISYNKKDLIFEKSSKFSVQFIDDSGETALDEAYGWKKPDKFGVKFDTTGTTVKVTGLLPILESFEDEKDPFKGEEATGYYLPFVIKTDAGNRTDNEKLTVQFIHEGEESKTLTAANFDGNDVLYILRHLDKKATDRTFEIVVDMDGDGEEYAPYTITFDWSELKLQEKTVAEVKVDSASAADKEQLKGYGYKSEVNSDIKISDTVGNYTLEGKLVEQVLNDNVFTEKTGYYFDFTFKLPEGVEPKNVKISHLTDGNLNDDSKIKKTFKESEYDKQDNSLTILYQFTEDPKCKANSGNCKLYYSVDYDGEGDEYLPTLVTIDYSKLTFEKSSLFTVVGIDNTNKDQYDDDGWYNEEDGYSVKVVKDDKDPNKYKVSGVLPKLEDSDWDGNDAPFEDNGSLLYYLGLGLKLTNAPEDYNSQTDKIINILFEHDAESKNFSKKFDDDFDTSSTVYILKALKATNEDGSPLKDSEKWFTITVDLDGDDNDEYAPYEVTIDYSDLEFQDDSLGNIDFDVLSKEDLENDSAENKELQGYGYDFDKIKGVSIKTNEEEQPDREPSKVGIQGSIKEQTLNNGFDNNKGYFVPIKISVPKDESWFTKHQNDWTINLYTETGDKKTYIPTSEEYKQGWVMVLFRLNDTKSTKELKYEIDFDGEGKAFLPYEYTIKYEDLKFQTENKITFEYFDEKTGKIITTDEIVYQGEAIPNTLAPQIDDKNYSYHKFDYWYEEGQDSNTGFRFGTDSTDKDEDITLKAHWTIDVDTFLADVVTDLKDPDSLVSGNFSDKFDIEKSGNTITFKVKDSTTLVSEMNKTSIPGTIAYILQRGEIKNITLTFGEKKIVFTKDGTNDQIQLANLDATGSALKEKIQAGAKALFQDVLEDESTMTLNKMAVDDRDFKITIGELDDSVQLKEGAKTSYTFDFITDVTGVKSEAELTAALKNPSIKHIDITGSFDVKESVEVARDVIIDGGSNNYTITADSGVDTIFKVKDNSVTIENIELKNAKTPIVVESGNLISKNLKISGETTEAGIEVKKGGNLTLTGLKYDKEHYNNPAVRAEKDSTKVDFKDKDSKTALRVTKEKITKYSSEGVGSYGDVKEEDRDYKYYNYYNDSNNSKIYETIFHNYEGRQILKFVSYNYYNEKVSLPPEDVFKAFYGFSYDGNTYELLGFTESRDKTIYDGEEDYTKLPEGVVNKDDLKAQDDKTYYSAYKVSLPENVTKVTNAQGLKEALENEKISEIYINTDAPIDMTGVMDEISISRKLSIIGKPAISKIKLKNINISADDIFLSRLNLEFTDGTNNDSSLINIKDSAQDVSLWQCTITNSGDAVDYAIYYHGNNKSIVDIRWSTFNNSGNKFNEGYVYVSNELATGSNIYLNTFKKLTTDDSKKAAVIINKFSSEDILQEDNNIKMDSNTFDVSDYAVKIEKDASGTKSNISMTTNYETNIAVEYSDNQKDFSNILFDANKDKVKVTYIDQDGHIQEGVPEGVKALKFKGQIEMVPSNVPESATISGLTKNGNKYSGLVSQSDDGKFYLPLTLTSSKFDDRVSTVTVTDPNENSEKYLYSLKSNNGVAVISSANTMKLNLEAIKSSKINNEAGKVYNIAIDYNGDKKTDNTYTIDYSGVETLEEKINAAAQNTLNSKSFTVTKDNHINGYTEAFTYKFNSELGLTHLTSTKDNVEEYTFSLKYVGKEDSKVSVVTRKQTEHEEGKVYINDWEYIHPIQVGRAIQEVTMLTDVMGETYINAIDKVKIAEGKEHTYIATLNRDKYNDWVKKNYLSNSKYSSAEWALNEIVEVEIKLDDNEQYIKSIKTSQKSSDNTFNVSFENVNSTEIKAPKEFLAENEKALTEQDIIDFYNEGIKWWEKYTGSTVYSE